MWFTDLPLAEIQRRDHAKQIAAQKLVWHCNVPDDGNHLRRVSLLSELIIDGIKSCQGKVLIPGVQIVNIGTVWQQQFIKFDLI